MKHIAVFVSGGGSNLQAVIDGIKKDKLNAKVALVISSKQGVYAEKRAEAENIPYFVYERKNYVNTDKMFAEISVLLKKYNIDFIVLAGYLSILSEALIKEYKNKIINVHPALIPSFCGKGYYGLKVHQAVLDYGAKVTGVTVHFADEGADTGAIILQESVEVSDDDDCRSLQEKVLKIEHKLLPLAVKLLIEDRIVIEGRKARIIPR